ncbi:MAG: glycoside hydrolase family 3 C-terminal domain-containing protein [Prevotella sp.]|nr:glycoside hydrolase family 3 C-terminal domain-containing protein [Candidatus Prevotella equi]
MKQTLTLSLLLACTMTASAQTSYPWMDKSLSFHERAKLLVKELTLREKVDQLGNNVSEPIKRNGVIILPSYQYWNEALHGVARSGAATSFPESKGMSATWDRQLIYDCANATSDEARIYHVNTGKGLNYWSPTINMSRDPRWGRDEENYGEDPFLAGTLAVQFIKGFQGEITPSTPYYKIIACAKHFAANNYEQGRQSTTSFVSEKNMREYYLPAFEMSVKQGGVMSLMSAYNALSIDPTELDANNVGYSKAHGGLPCSANRMLLTDILRGEWGFKGYVTSDCAALSCIHRATKHLYFGNYTAGQANTGSAFADMHAPYANSTEEEQIMEARSASMAIKAGCETNCEFKNQSSVMQRAAVNAVDPAFQAKEKPAPNGKTYIDLTEADIDTAVVRVLETRFALGEFDNYTYPVSNTLESKANQNLALKAAQESITLLRNEIPTGATKPILPIEDRDTKIALIGPFADAIMLGDYSGTPTYTTTPFQAFAKKMDFSLSDGTVQFEDYNSVSCKRGEAKFKNAGGFVENTSNGDYIVFNEIDFGSGCSDFAVYCATKKGSGEGSINFYLDNATTPALSISNSSIAAGAWSTYATIKAKCDANVFKGKHKVTVKWSSSMSYVGNWDWFRFYNEGVEPLETQGPLFMVKTTGTVNEVAPQSMIDRAVATAKLADVVIFIGGTDFSKPDDHATGTESHDRWKLTLPGNQEDVLKAIYAANPNTVLVLESGSSLDIRWAKDNIPAIMEAWYGGQAQGQAICDAVFGDINPAGKLTSTWYNSIDELPQETKGLGNTSSLGRKGMMEYDIDDWGYTYMYYGKGAKNPCQAEKPLFPFGYGLSYTTFSYGKMTANKASLHAGETAKVTATITNTGTRDGAEVVQLYANFNGDTHYGKNGNMRHKLIGFERVELKAGESKTIEIPVDYRQLAYFNTDDHNFQVAGGDVTIELAAASDDIRQTVSINTVKGVAEETFISTNINDIPNYTAKELLKTDHIYSVMGAYICEAQYFERLPKGVYVLNGVKYIKK